MALPRILTAGRGSAFWLGSSLVGCLAATVATGALAGPAWAASPARASRAYEPGQLIVRYRKHTSKREEAQVRKEERAKLVEELPLVDGLELVQIKRGESVRGEASDFEEHPEVKYAEPNYVRSFTAQTPNDPFFTSHLWGLNNTGQTVNGVTGKPDADIDAPEAWEYSKGSKDVVVAVIDSGVDYNHPDLAPNIWTNPGESGGGKETNGADDDGNGFVDDFRGWDFGNNDNDPMDPHSHGTHVAGTIGAVGDNGLGITGVAWSANLMPVKIGDEQGGLSAASVIEGLGYAVRAGAKVVNGSFGGGNRTQAEEDAIKAAKDKTLFVVAAGNDRQNNDREPFFPCNFKSPNLVCVAATDQKDELAIFSNYGEQNVDIAAPGMNIYSTIPGGGYGFKNGTSMAAPHVAGAAALLFSFQKDATPSKVREAIVSVLFDKLDSLRGKVATSGRLGLPTTKPPDNPPPRPDPKKPPPSTPPSNQPTYPDPVTPEAPTPYIYYLFPVPRTTIIIIGGFDDLNGYLGNVNLGFVREVIVSLERRVGGGCQYMTTAGMIEHDCSDPLYLEAGGTGQWDYNLSPAQRATLRPGNYTVRVRLITTSGQSLLVSEQTFSLAKKVKKAKKRKRSKRRR
jgi:subtilisin family serine protease